MGQGTSFPPEKRIVVVGGGFAGITLCMHLLDKDANFKLVDTRDAFHYNLASVRAIVKPELARKILMPYKDTFGDHFVQGKMTTVDPDNKTIHLNDGHELTYDILVVAVGSSGAFPSKMGDLNRMDALEKYDNYAKQVHSSKNIVIVGGGAVGVEIAGEIATKYPDKDVTLIHGGRHLVWDHLSTKFQHKVQNALRTLGVHVILEEMVPNISACEENCEVKTSGGRELHADLLIKCTGLTINSQAYENGLGKYLDERDAIRINRYFQVDGQEDIFAMGDCCASGDKLTAYLAMEQSKMVAQNICRKLNGQGMVKYKGGTAFELILTVGPRYAFGELKNGWTIPDYFCRQVKADLMVARFRAIMRQNK